jgi:hypothetical protein
VGLTLNIFGMAYLDVQFTYGVSFWIFVGGLAAFIVIIGYEQMSMYKLERQRMILALIQGEKKIAQKMNMNIELSSEGDNYF